MSILKKNSVGGLVFDIFNHVLMVVMCITILFPLWDMIVLSFGSPADSNNLVLRLWPREWRIDAYAYCFSDPKMLNAFFVTVGRTVAGTAIHVIVTLIAAYPLSKKDLPLRNPITVYFLIPMFFGGGLIPSYLINRSLGFIDNPLVYVIPGAVGIFTVLLVRNYMMSIDAALEESALIDGAGYMTILWKIIVPVAKPIIATIALWAMVGQWNSWFDCLIYIRTDRWLVLQVILRRMIDMNSQTMMEQQQFMLVDPTRVITTKTVQAATTVITIVPIIATYPFLQKYFVKGIMIGSLKG